jgi:hypothetical protein
VEEAQSPLSRGGFQTLFYTTGSLTEAEVEEMEGRLLYFASTVEPVKRLFFSTASGKAVIAQIVFLPAPDRFGRGGRYLAHSLIFEAESLARFEADPFRVFRQFPFITTIAAAIGQGDIRSGHIPPVLLDLPPSLACDVTAAQDWSPEGLKKLSLLALRAGQHTRQRETVTFIGDASQIENALAAAYLAVPASRRCRCTFDTYFYRCNLVATYFWAVGLPEPPGNIRFAQVDCGSRRLVGQVPTLPETAYEHWVVQKIVAGDVADLVRFRDRAEALGEWLDGRQYTPSLLDAAPTPLISEIFEASPPSVQSSLRREIAGQLPSELADRAANHLFHHATGLGLYQELRQGFKLRQLLDILYDSYATASFKAPSKAEIKALETLLWISDHQPLRLLWAYWTDPGRQLPELLQESDEADYRQFVTAALELGLVEPRQLIVPGKGNAFLDLYPTAEVDELPDLTEKLSEAGELACLAQLTAGVPDSSPKALKRLQNVVAQNPDTPEPFRQAVEAAIAALPPETGLRGKVKLVFRNIRLKF